jgi:hypothetical protein
MGGVALGIRTIARADVRAITVIRAHNGANNRDNAASKAGSSPKTGEAKADTKTNPAAATNSTAAEATPPSGPTAAEVAQPDTAHGQALSPGACCVNARIIA